MTQRNSVVVEGVTISREALEKAVQELNTPIPQLLIPGDIVMWPDKKYHPMQPFLVVGGDLNHKIAGYYGDVYTGGCRITDGHQTWVCTQSNLVRIGSLQQIKEGVVRFENHP